MPYSTHVHQGDSYTLVASAKYARDELELTLYHISKIHGAFYAQSYDKAELILQCPILTVAPELISVMIKHAPKLALKGNTVEATFSLTIGHSGPTYAFTVLIACVDKPLSQAERSVMDSQSEIRSACDRGLPMRAVMDAPSEIRRLRCILSMAAKEIAELRKRIAEPATEGEGLQKKRCLDAEAPK